jgi:hypothetical protein
MIKGILIGDLKVDLPTSWNEVTLEQLYRMQLWQKMEDGDVLMMVSILIGVEYEILNKVEPFYLFEAVILKNLGWISEWPDLSKLPRLEKLNIRGVEIEVPKDLALETVAQKWAVDQKMAEYAGKHSNDPIRCGFHQMSYFLAAYLTPKINGDFDMKTADLTQAAVKQMPAFEVLPIGSFFLKKYLASKLWSRALRPLRGLMSRRLRTGVGSKGLGSSGRGMRFQGETSLNTMKL